jgi:hypothetical protein
MRMVAEASATRLDAIKAIDGNRANLHSPDKTPAAVDARTIIPTKRAHPTDGPNVPSMEGEIAMPQSATLAD